MTEISTISQIIALSLGAAWASGINLYATILVLGLMGATGTIELPENLLILQNTWVLIAAGVLYIAEFFADKIPLVDTVWDTIHTFIRIPAGVMMAVGAVGGLDPGIVVAAGLIGGTVTTGTHIAKASTRAVVNTSPEPVSNWTLSVTEDVAVVGGLWTALNYPLVFIGLLILFVLAIAWTIPKVWRFIVGLFRKKKAEG
jgi:hypothetical protein